MKGGKEYQGAMLKTEMIMLSLLLIISVSIGSTGCMNRENPRPEQQSKADKVSIEVLFRAFSGDKLLEGVQIMIIDRNGDVADVFETDNKGEAEKELSVEVDKKYGTNPDGIGPRGTVTVIARKAGYRDAVQFEVPVSDGSAAQPIAMEPIVEGERNEPTVELGNNHHLEVLSLVDRYSTYFHTEQ
jgi:hypothetical protein